MNSVTTISTQAGRRYPQFSGSQNIAARQLRSIGTSGTAFTAKFRKTLSELGGRVGTRQIHGGP